MFLLKYLLLIAFSIDYIYQKLFFVNKNNHIVKYLKLNLIINMLISYDNDTKLVDYYLFVIVVKTEVIIMRVYRKIQQKRYYI